MVVRCALNPCLARGYQSGFLPAERADEHRADPEITVNTAESAKAVQFVGYRA